MQTVRGNAWTSEDIMAIYMMWNLLRFNPSTRQPNLQQEKQRNEVQFFLVINIPPQGHNKQREAQQMFLFSITSKLISEKIKSVVVGFFCFSIVYGLSWVPEDGGLRNHGGHHIWIHVGGWPSVLEVALAFSLRVSPNPNRRSTVGHTP